jgi:DNA mismatch endonuclease (patch repair protein)
MSRWGPQPPLAEVWKVPTGPRSQQAAEQDKAAGGRSARFVRLLDGRTATGSIRLKHLPKSRRIYAYLRYSVDGQTRTKYAGDATADTREKALKQAWSQAQTDGLMVEQAVDDTV